MKIGPSGFCMPVSSGCTVLKREAVLKVPQPFRGLTTTATTVNFYTTSSRPGLFQLSSFLRVRNKTLSIVAMCVCNPDRSPVGINR
jgi:hypothetical protein